MVLALPGLALAQESQPAEAAVATDSGAIIYDQAFFARFGVNNAEDMLRRIPGVPALLDGATGGGGGGGGQRGFGSGGAQVLINGRRFPGKSNEINATLRRIPAGNIERVELVRESSGDIGVQSRGMVVNIIMKPGASIAGAGSYEVSGRFNTDGFADVDGLLSYSNAIGALSYSIGVERSLWSPSGMFAWNHRSRAEVFFYPDGRVQELRPQEFTFKRDQWTYTGQLNWEISDTDSLNLNGLYQTRYSRETENSQLVRFTELGAETLRARETRIRENDLVRELEIGGEYTSQIGPGGLTALFIVNRRDNPTFDDRVRFEPARTVELSRNDAEVRTGEDIVRGAYSLGLFRGQTVEFGAEFARNTRNQDIQSFADLGADGVLEPITIPTAEARVKERRGELFLNHKWILSDRLSFDSSIAYEFSTLTTNYTFQPTRKLQFYKPRVDARYKVNASDQLQLLVERQVGQLNFGDFVPSYNFVDDRIELGNPAIMPERIWRYEGSYERRLPQDGGALKVRAFYDDVTDETDNVPLLRDGRVISVAGNVGKAKKYGVEGTASIRLTMIRLPDAILSLRGIRQATETIDPFTGRTRRTRGDRKYNFDIGFRHDVTSLKLSYGLNYENYGLSSISNDMRVTEYSYSAPTLEGFVERSLTGSTTLRFEVQNISNARDERRRIQWANGVAAGVVRRIDFYREERDLRVAIRLRGRF